ncbi:MAG: VCBS repeat-containing protein, partial [Deltaproteobacteria bacterium]|nr:VCBS repeat-containing protein [Deltaproteobacteria bacterium]
MKYILLFILSVILSVFVINIACAQDLLVSSMPDRSSSEALQDSNLAGWIYVFLSFEVDIQRVSFYLDDPEMERPPYNVDILPPFDLAGTSSEGGALAFDTSGLIEGTHEIAVLIELTTMDSIFLRSTFEVSPLIFNQSTNIPIQGLEQGGHGAAWADIDEDEDPDLYVTNNYSLELLPDLLIINIDGENFFEDGVNRNVDDLDTGTHGAIWADLDNDGDYDLWNGAYTVNNLYENKGSMLFIDITGESGIEKDDGLTRGVLSFDMDADGDLDLFANNWGSASGQENELYVNNGNMNFSATQSGDLTTAIGSQGATVGDLDGDGDADIILGDFEGSHNIFVFLNDNNGNYSLQENIDIGLPSSGRIDGITMSDLDSDGSLDLIIADPNEKFIYLNNGDGTFYFLTSMLAPGFMANVGDFDNDGDVDIYCPGDNRIFLNNGNSRFTPSSHIGLIDTSASDPRCTSLADVDNDGDIDIIN